jgi:Cu/Ag efflux protein CusF
MARFSKFALVIMAIVAGVFLLWYGVRSSRTAKIKRYSITGTIVAVHRESNTVGVHNDTIPGFMEPMDMDYRADPAVLSKLKSGDKIRATLATDNQGVWSLENVAIVPPAPSPPTAH